MDDVSRSITARIERIDPRECDNGASACQTLMLLGSDGTEFTVQTDDQSFIAGKPLPLESGQTVIVETQVIDGTAHYVFSDVTRTTPLAVLFACFILFGSVLGRMKVLRSVIGMLAGIAVLFWFMLPRMLAGDPPVTVALIGAFVIMGLTFTITHGFNIKMWSAFLGTCVSLVLTAVLASLFSSWAWLFGLADEHAVFLLSDLPRLDTRGLLLAGIIIGTLGSLDDVTISQASAVFEIKLADATLTSRELYRRAIRIGHDHIAGAINTLVLAYAGASLPLLLLVANSAHAEPFGILVSREMFATEIVRTLVGSIGLLAAIPFTNLFASHFASKASRQTLEKVTGHSHHH